MTLMAVDVLAGIVVLVFANDEQLTAAQSQASFLAKIGNKTLFPKTLPSGRVGLQRQLT